VNRITIDLDALKHNLQAVNGMMDRHGATWSLVVKMLCGHADTLRALQSLGVHSMADSRLANLRAVERVVPDFESWYLRLPHRSAIPDIVSLADVSLNSETEIIEALDAEARRQDRLHRIIVMIELGDLREGVLPGSLVKFYKRIFRLRNVNVLGIGANLGCLSGAVPNIDQFMQLVLYKELLELKFDHRLPMISAGSSIILPLLEAGQVPAGINHFRIGEAVFLGTDLVNGGTLPGMRDDVITVEAEIVEIKEKGLMPLGDTTGLTPFEPLDNDSTPGQRGYRAIVTLGQLDTEVGGLTPLDREHQIAGASSDLTVVNVGSEPRDLRIGGSIRFRPNYGATLRLMNNPYMERVVVPSPDRFAADLPDEDAQAIPRVLGPAD